MLPLCANLGLITCVYSHTLYLPQPVLHFMQLSLRPLDLILHSLLVFVNEKRLVTASSLSVQINAEEIIDYLKTGGSRTAAVHARGKTD